MCGKETGGLPIEASSLVTLPMYVSEHLTQNPHNLHAPGKLIIVLRDSVSVSLSLFHPLSITLQDGDERGCAIWLCIKIISFKLSHGLNGFFTLNALAPQNRSQPLCIVWLTVSLWLHIRHYTMSVLCPAVSDRVIALCLPLLCLVPTCLRPFSDTRRLTFSCHTVSHN